MYEGSSTSLLVIVKTAILVPPLDGVKFNTRSSELAAKTFVGKETTEKSAEFTPETVAEEIFNGFKVPRFSIVKIVGVIVAIGELIREIPPETKDVPPSTTLIS
jgi:hypothetical protein